MAIRTQEEKAKLVDEIQTLIKGGESVDGACKKMQVNTSNYYHWIKGMKKDKKRAKSEPQLVTMNFTDNDDSPLFIFMGRAKDLNHALDRIAQIQKGDK